MDVLSRCGALVRAGLLALTLFFSFSVAAQVGTVAAYQKISSSAGGFTGTLDDTDLFGASSAPLADLDGDGVPDVAVGAPNDDDGGPDHGAVWILFLKADGTVKGHQKISDTAGGFTGVLSDETRFGYGLAALGDVDGDGVVDLAVGAFLDDDGGPNRGAVWVLFLKADGTVKGHQKISDTAGGFTGTLDDDDFFGFSVGVLGDIDGDGVADLGVGAYRDDDGGTDRGAVWMLFLKADGTVKGHQKISDTVGGFSGTLSDGDLFGSSVAAPGDVDGDGVRDLAVGAIADDDGGTDRGAVWMLFLKADGTVKGHQKISDTVGGFTSALADDDLFGVSAASPGDLNSDGTPDLLVGAELSDLGGRNRGSIWVLFLKADGTVLSEVQIAHTTGGFGPLDDDGAFGSSIAPLGDLNSDSVLDLAVGAFYDQADGPFRGAAWVLFMRGAHTMAITPLASRGGAPIATPVAMPSGGGTVFYKGTGTNGTRTDLTTEVWSSIRLPSGAVITENSARTVTIRRLRSREFQRSLNINSALPAGTYTITLYIGTHPSVTLAQASFDVEKAAPRTGAPVLSEAEVTALAEAAFFGDATADAASVLDPSAPDGVAVLGSAYPNPFNPTATVPFTLAQDGDVRLAVYDLLGREVAVLAQGRMAAGSHTAVFDAGQLSSGTYLVRFASPDGQIQTQRLTLLK